MPKADGDITQLLKAWNDGCPDALTELLDLVHEELHIMARIFFAKESSGHTLQPTAVVNELYLKLLDQRHVQWENRAHFFGSMGTLIRRILVDYARRRQAGKRGKGLRLTLSEPVDLADDRVAWDPVELIALDTALEALKTLDSRQGRILEQRLFAGLTVGEIEEVEGISRASVYRELNMAKLFLKRELCLMELERDMG